MHLLGFIFGIWRAVLTLPGGELPFNFDLLKENNKIVFVIHNASERIRCDEVTVKGDSLIIRLPVFDSEFRIKADSLNMSGNWINYSRKEVPSIEFHAVYGDQTRFHVTKRPLVNVDGKWEAWFDAGTPDSSIAIGEFNQKESTVTGTFLSETGDHRYLQGVVDGDSLKLSVFDGSHCWLYLAEVSKDGKMHGTTWYGKHAKSDFIAHRNEKVTLRDPNAITTFTGKPVFTFPDADSNLVSLSDDRYKGKVVLMQILGSWCPNCMDESLLMSEIYAKEKSRGLEIIGLSFEKTSDFTRAAANIKRMQQRFKMEYAVLLAGTTGSGNVEKALPGLHNFISFPSMIIVKRDGTVAGVHAGYSGPATGDAYTKFRSEFEKEINILLTE